jgi:hypothetical protein
MLLIVFNRLSVHQQLRKPAPVAEAIRRLVEIGLKARRDR